MKKLSGFIGGSLLCLLLAAQPLFAATASNPASPQFLQIYSEIKSVFKSQGDLAALQALDALKNALEAHLSVNQQALEAVDQLLRQRPDNSSAAQTKRDLLQFRQTLHHEYLRHILALGKNNHSLPMPMPIAPSPDPEKNLYQTVTSGTDISIEIGVGDPHETIIE